MSEPAKIYPFPVGGQETSQQFSSNTVNPTSENSPYFFNIKSFSHGPELSELMKLQTSSVKGDGMPTDQELTDAKLRAVGAETDTKIARLEGKMDLVLEAVRSSREEARDNRRAVIANAWVVFGALVVVVGIIAAAAPVIFDLGSKFRESITKEIHDQLTPRFSPQTAPTVPLPQPK